MGWHHQNLTMETLMVNMAELQTLSMRWLAKGADSGL